MASHVLNFYVKYFVSEVFKLEKLCSQDWNYTICKFEHCPVQKNISRVIWFINQLEWGGFGDSFPKRMSPKQPLPGVSAHDPQHGRQTCPDLKFLLDSFLNLRPGGA